MNPGQLSMPVDEIGKFCKAIDRVGYRPGAEVLQLYMRGSPKPTTSHCERLLPSRSHAIPLFGHPIGLELGDRFSYDWHRGKPSVDTTPSRTGFACIACASRASADWTSREAIREGAGMMAEPEGLRSA